MVVNTLRRVSSDSAIYMTFPQQSYMMHSFMTTEGRHLRVYSATRWTFEFLMIVHGRDMRGQRFFLFDTLFQTLHLQRSLNTLELYRERAESPSQEDPLSSQGSEQTSYAP